MDVDTVVTNAIIVTEHGRCPNAGIAIQDGTIVAIGDTTHLPDADRVIDVDGRIVVPGIIDCHIHNREPGLEYKEDWQTATSSAAAGGITTVVGMPNTDPIIDQPEHLTLKFDRGESSALVDFQSYAVITSSNIDSIEALADAGAIGFKIFLGTTVGGVPAPNDGEIIEAMKRVADTGKRLGFHEENGEIIEYYEHQFQANNRNEPIDHAHSRPVIAEREAVERMISFASDIDVPIHMFHVSSGSAAKAVALGKQKGVDVTAETTPHYLWFTEEILAEKGSIARVNPPLRNETEQQLLWEVGINEGVIDCFATDHAPHTDAEKSVDDPFADTWGVMSGFVGLETAVPAMLTFVSEGKLTLENWVHRHSTRPAQIWGMYPQKGSLTIGTDADLTVIEPETVWTLDDRTALHSKSTVTPFEGETFTGSVYATMVRGEIVYQSGEVIGESGFGSRVNVDS